MRVLAATSFVFILTVIASASLRRAPAAALRLAAPKLTRRRDHRSRREQSVNNSLPNTGEHGISAAAKPAMDPRGRQIKQERRPT